MMKHKEQDGKIFQIPDKFLKIMDSLTDAQSKVQDIMGDQFDLRYFVSQFLIYTIAESDKLLTVENINKKNLYDYIYGKDSDKNGIKDKIEEVRRNYTSIYPSALDEISYETAKKRMKEMLPSQHRKNNLDQSHYLNIHETHALLIHFLIYPSKYRRFLSNPNSKNVKVPEFDMIIESMEDLFTPEPLSQIPSKLFAKSVIKDSIHTRMFNALTIFIIEMIREFLELTKLLSKQDTLAVLFVLDQMISDIPEITKTWTTKYLELIKMIHSVSNNKNVQESVLNAIKDKESLSYAKDNLLKLFEKYDSIHKDKFAKEDDEIENDDSSDNDDDENEDDSDNNSNEDEDEEDDNKQDDSFTEDKDNVDNESSQNQDDEDNVTTTVLDNDDSNNTFKENVQKHILPDTASDHYNTIISGMILIVVGAFLYVYYSIYSFVRKRFN